MKPVSPTSVLEFITIAGGAAGGIVTIIGLLSIIAKKPAAWFKGVVKEEMNDVINYMKNNSEEQRIELQNINIILNNINSQLDYNQEATICVLRHSITKIYEEYKTQKAFPINIKEDICKMYESYTKLGGNSYVHVIYEEMMNWDVI